MSTQGFVKGDVEVRIPREALVDQAPSPLCAASADLAVQLLAAARMAAVLAGMLSLSVGSPPSACPFRGGALHDAYFSGRWQALKARRGETS